MFQIGQKVVFLVSHPAGQNETVTIVKPRAGEATPGPDWFIVRFADGGKLCVHETGLRAV